MYENSKVNSILDIPDYLCCKISFDLIRDPYITNCGISYEKDILMDHITKNGSFDPVTRKPIT